VELAINGGERHQLRRCLSWGSAAKKHLEFFTLPEKARAVTEITVDGHDGSMPEIARLDFTVSSDEKPGLTLYFIQQCTRFKMHAPSDYELGIEPDLLCVKDQSGESLNFYVYTNCQSNNCLH